MTQTPVSAFSRSFARHLRSVMEEHNVKQNAIAEHLGRSKAYVSEHTSGTRAVDTDLLDAVAVVANVQTRDLIIAIAEGMGRTLPPRIEVVAGDEVVVGVGDDSPQRAAVRKGLRHKKPPAGDQPGGDEHHAPGGVTTTT